MIPQNQEYTRALALDGGTPERHNLHDEGAKVCSREHAVSRKASYEQRYVERKSRKKSTPSDKQTSDPVIAAVNERSTSDEYVMWDRRQREQSTRLSEDVE